MTNIDTTRIDWKVLKRIQIVLFFSKRNVDLGFGTAAILKESLKGLFENDPILPFPNEETLPLEVPRIMFHDSNKKIILSKQKVEIGVETQSRDDIQLLGSVIEKICDCFKEQTFSRIGIIFEHEDNKQEFIDTIKTRFVKHDKMSSAKEFTLMWANRFECQTYYNMNLAYTVFCSTLPEFSGNTIGRYILDYNTVPEKDYNLNKDAVNIIWTYCFSQYGVDKNVLVEQE